MVTLRLLFSNPAIRTKRLHLKELTYDRRRARRCGERTGNVPAQDCPAMTSSEQTGFMAASIEGQSYAGILPILDTTTEWISTAPNTVSQALTGSITAEQCMKTSGRFAIPQLTADGKAAPVPSRVMLSPCRPARRDEAAGAVPTLRPGEAQNPTARWRWPHGNANSAASTWKPAA